jgi:hypothetical protein
MNSIPELANFFYAIREDPRIGPVHISLYMAIIQEWSINDCKDPIRVYSRDLMQLAKISGIATYHRSVRDLNDFGYIKYQPSYNRFSKSLIYVQDSIRRV